MIDLRQSRRTYNEYCRWWSRDERDQNTPDELIMRRIPSGQFWAKEVSPESARNNIIGGVFMLDSSHITIKTPDDCTNLKSEDLLEYLGEKWIIVDVQKSKAHVANTEFSSASNYQRFWYIELRK